MPKRTKRFIDKKNSVTFQLVHRSQKDPLVTDENAPKRVLQPILKDERNDDLEKFGIYFDDDYDYMQHLKPSSGSATLLPVDQPVKQKKEDTRISLPSSVFASHVEEKVGVLNKAAPSRGLDLSLDPEVIAALDSDYDFSDPENEFEDDFVLQLNAKQEDGNESDVGSDDLMEGFSDEEDEGMCDGELDMDELGSLNEMDTKSRFTDYSMTSSVMRRNDQLRHLDDRFEEMFAGYDETEIGALDCEEIEGDVDLKSDILMKIADEFEKSRKTEKLVTEPTELGDFSESDSDDESECSLVEVKEREKWDCESILSTYSNIYNHPKIIDAPPSKIKINAKTGIPETKMRLTAKALAALSGGDDNFVKATGPRSLATAVSALSIRPKDEKPEERHDRKKAFRIHKQERRKEKKLNTTAFKEEKRRVEKMMAHNKTKHIVKI